MAWQPAWDWSAVSFAGAMVFQEMLLQHASTDVYISRFSLAAAIAGAIACGAFESKKIRDFPFTWVIALLIIVLSVTQTVYYTGHPYVMKHSSAAEMNLSFLTSTFLVSSFWFSFMGRGHRGCTCSDSSAFLGQSPCSHFCRGNRTRQKMVMRTEADCPQSIAVKEILILGFCSLGSKAHFVKSDNHGQIAKSEAHS
jgi:hypothetical protein